jgi:hypothetical protein
MLFLQSNRGGISSTKGKAHSGAKALASISQLALLLAAIAHAELKQIPLCFEDGEWIAP